jgi:GPI ethanolamine phosphate transferase 2/3 subunit F
MWNSLPVVVGIQLVYAILSLPPAGSQSFKPPRKLRPGEKKKPTTEGQHPNIAVVRTSPCWSLTVANNPEQTTTVALVLSLFATIVLHVFFVLFGAPFLTHIPHTLLCSLYLSIFGLFPLFYTRGVSNKEWLEILGTKAPLDEAFGGFVGGCFGAWLGAVPIPLDWDREWQKWPITILCGVLVGYISGKSIGGTVAFGKRFY